MAKMIRWSCPECDEETHFKGLCRQCTEYDADGIPIKPVHRVRLNHTPTEHHFQKRTKADYVNARRKNPSKKQLEKIKEVMNAQSQMLHQEHDCCANETCEHKGEDEEDDFRPIGQGITDEVTQAIKEMEEMGYAVVNDVGGEEE
tara:strand:- start:1485 stop:1919 length:435 start_codon:yes stop_codon:yes gene_type:complete